MAKDTSLIVEPPAIARFRESTADPATVQAMADTIEPGKWITNGEEYEEAAFASLDSNVYKRAVARKLSVEDHKIRTRTWGMKGGKPAFDKKAKGAKWYFALTHDPERQKQTKRKNGES